MAELIPNTTLQHTDNNNVGGQLNVYLYTSDTMYNNLYVTMVDIVTIHHTGQKVL